MSSSFLPDFKYFDLIHGRQIRRDGLSNIRFPPLKNVAGAFFNNLARTDSFSVFPAIVAFEAIRDQLSWDVAVFKATGKISLILHSHKFKEKTKRLIEQELKKIQKTQRRRFLAGKDTFDAKIRMGAKQIQLMAAHELGASQSLEALLFAVIVESWMTFETLAADLFYTALDHGLPEWRINVGSKYSEFKRGSNWEPQKVGPSAAHDPQREYGSFLRGGGMISFQRFREIKFWYKTAFGANVENLFRTVEGGYIRALSAVRNVILHKAATADATYITEVRKFPELAGAGENKLIQLDGEIVRKLRNAAIALGLELISHIDEAIAPNVKP